LWWVDLDWTPGAHQAALSLLSRQQEEKNDGERLVGRDKDRVITQQLPSQEKQS